MTDKCCVCGSLMTGDEAALNKKLVCRTCPVEEFLCPECLGKKLGTSAGELREMIEKFRRQGCMLFSPITDN